MPLIVNAAAAYPSVQQPTYGTFVEQDARRQLLDDTIETAIRNHRARIAYYRQQSAHNVISEAASVESLVSEPPMPQGKSLWRSIVDCLRCRD